MRTLLLGLLTGGFLTGIAFSQSPPGASSSPVGTALEIVASFPKQQVTGVTVSKTGRIFVNFPDWSEDHTLSVAEIVDGKPKPFPDEEWNKPGAPATHFVCVQSVVVDDTDSLWILDPAAPKMRGIVNDGPKLVKVDLATNRVVQTIPFAKDIAPAESYLNDVRVDTRRGVAFITESGEGALIVVNLKSGNARRLLEDHPSTQSEPGFKLVVDGRELIEQKTGKPPKMNADGIALDAKNGWLYYHALTAHTLYRIKTDDLLNESLSAKELEAKVEKVTETPAPDGMLEGNDGSVFLTDLEDNAIKRFDPVSRQLGTVIQDKRLMWPDTMSWGPDGSLYVTSSQIENMPRFNNGKSTQTEPYCVYKLKVP